MPTWGGAEFGDDVVSKQQIWDWLVQSFNRGKLDKNTFVKVAKEVEPDNFIIVQAIKQREDLQYLKDNGCKNK